MKQMFQSASSGETTVVDVPAPAVLPGGVLVRTAASLISAGTERTAVEFSKKSLLQKARSRPDLVKKVLDKAKTEGMLQAVEAAFTRLDQPIVLGYSSAGTVIEVGQGVTDFRVGDRVACAGGGYASHAEIVSVPKNLVAPVPEGVDLRHAAFTTVGAIGLHGFRVSEAELGEVVVVLGLGLIGLLTVQIARAAGCRVIGIDLDPDRVALARTLGAEAATTTVQDPEALVRAHSEGRGADVVLITAGTSSNAPIELAGELARDRGRVVVVGAVGMDLPRPPFYDKELSFRISRSYGPGRYDPSYEEGGIDYPIGHVRWTENRNLRSFLQLVSDGSVQIEPVLTVAHPIAEAPEAYRRILDPSDRALGVLLTYPEGPSPEEDRPVRTVAIPGAARKVVGEIGIGLLGAGNFATATLLPAIGRAGGYRMVGVVTRSGTSAQHAAAKHGFGFASTSEREITAHQDVDLIAIATRHDLHARQIISAMEAGKSVFCEKPPCLNPEELADIIRAAAASPASTLLVGYNRRFAPMARELRDHFASVGEPCAAHYRVNAGFIPLDHWTHDPAVGGGRIIGEGCHFIDFLDHVFDARPVRVFASGLPDRGRYRSDNVQITLTYENGSVGTLLYTAAGHKGSGKERVEVFGGGKSAVLDDWRELVTHGGSGAGTSKNRLRQDKGWNDEWTVLRNAIRNGTGHPIPLESMVATSLATFGAVESLRTGRAVDIDARAFIQEALG